MASNLQYNIRPSEFNRRIIVNSFTPVTDSGGGTSNAATVELFRTWAKIENMGTNEKVQYGIDAFKTAFKLTMRFTTERQLTTQMQIVYNDAGVAYPLMIMGITLITEGYKRYQIIICQAFDVNG